MRTNAPAQNPAKTYYAGYVGRVSGIYSPFVAPQIVVADAEHTTSYLLKHRHRLKQVVRVRRRRQGRMNPN